MNKEQKTKNKEQVAIAMSPIVRQSVRKVNLVVKTIKYLSPAEALTALSFMPERAAAAVKKTIVQAVANATNSLKLSEQQLRQMEIQVQEGPTMKRFRIGGRGRVKPVLKRTSRITVRLGAQGGQQ